MGAQLFPQLINLRVGGIIPPALLVKYQVGRNGLIAGNGLGADLPWIVPQGLQPQLHFLPLKVQRLHLRLRCQLRFQGGKLLLQGGKFLLQACLFHGLAALGGKGNPGGSIQVFRAESQELQAALRLPRAGVDHHDRHGGGQRRGLLRGDGQNQRPVILHVPQGLPQLHAGHAGKQRLICHAARVGVSAGVLLPQGEERPGHVQVRPFALEQGKVHGLLQ